MTGFESAFSIVTPIVMSVFTAVGGWLMGRRKNKAEASLLEVKAISAIREFYETALNDTKKQLEYYIQLTEANRIEIESQKKELSEMRHFIEQILSKSCTVENCDKRKLIPITKSRFTIDKNKK